MYIKSLVFLFFAVFTTKAESSWEWVREGDIPCDSAVGVGVQSGVKTFLARAHLGGNLVPGYSSNKPGSSALVNYEGTTYKQINYEIFCNTNIAWQFINASKTPIIPSSAIHVGYLADGTYIYSCKGVPTRGDILIAGYVDPKTNLCILPLDEESISIDSYEILVDASSILQNDDGKEYFHWAWDSKEKPACPGDLVIGGIGIPTSNNPVKVARVNYGPTLIPGFMVESKYSYSATYAGDGRVQSTTVYEVLCGSGVAWMLTNSNSSIPTTAVEVGHTEDNQPIYSCRSAPNNSTTGIVPGWVDPTTNSCESFEADEYSYRYIVGKDVYEILVRAPLQ